MNDSYELILFSESDAYSKTSVVQTIIWLFNELALFSEKNKQKKTEKLV